jgi:hypothetical protein
VFKEMGGLRSNPSYTTMSHNEIVPSVETMMAMNAIINISRDARQLSLFWTVISRSFESPLHVNLSISDWVASGLFVLRLVRNPFTMALVMAAILSCCSPSSDELPSSSDVIALWRLC